MKRQFKDLNLTVSQALPAANANNNSPSIDLGAEAPGESLDEVDVLLEVPALPSLADGITATFTFQDSADNASFAPITGLSTLVLTGGGGAGAAAASRQVSLPVSVRRYIRVNQAVAASGGNNTAVSSTLSLRF